MKLIDADALLTTMKVNCPMENDLDSFKAGMRAVLERICNAPTVDAVEVVRCKECKFWDRTNMVTDIGFPDLARCLRGHKDYSDEFWYCADGERISE